MIAMTRTLRARFDGRTFVPLDPVDLTAGYLVRLKVEPEGGPSVGGEPLPGSPAAILKALKSMPPIDPEAAALFERSLAVAKAECKPADYRGTFDDLA